MGKNRYNLDEILKNEWMPKIAQHVGLLCEEGKVDNGETNPYLIALDLSDSGLNPYTIGEILEELGWEVQDRRDNGWQMDFWIIYEKDGCPDIQVRGTGITFEVFLSGVEN